MKAERSADRLDSSREGQGSGTVDANQGVAQHARWKLPAALFVVPALLGVLLSVPVARAGGTEGTIQLLAALNGAEALSASAMAKESAGGVGAGEAAGVHLPLVAPQVRLWDDFGVPAAPSIGETTVTVSGGGRQP